MALDPRGKRRLIAVTVTLLILMFSFPIHAAEAGAPPPSWWVLFIGLIGGLAFFLYGMEKMSDGLKKSAGNRMRALLSALTKNRILALIVGAFVTMVIQSSSATTVMLVSFVQANLMSFTQSLGVILGADIGTTVTAQLIAFKLTDYALLMVAIGFSLRMFSKTKNAKNLGEVMLGFGILFFGMKLMSDAMRPLRTYDEVISLMHRMENPALGLLAGSVFTALVQSSSASTGVVIVLAQQKLITLEAGIPIIFGANIGTCVTAGLASIGTSREAKRVALGHVLFKIAGVLLFIFWIPQFADLIHRLAVRFDSDTARQIANAHTLFNVSLAVVFLPFTTLFARLILKILPDKKAAGEIVPMTWHLNAESIATPAAGIDLARTEIARMARLLHDMLRASIIPFMSDERSIEQEEISTEEKELLIREIPKHDEHYPQLTLLQGIDLREEQIDFLEEKISDFLFMILRQENSADEATEVYGMLSITSDLESMSDIIHRNMVPLMDKKKDLAVDFSEEGKQELMVYHNKACKQIMHLELAFLERDLGKARTIMSKKKKYLALEEKYRIRHLERVRREQQESAKTHEVHMELMDLLKQVVVYSSNIAYTFVDKCKAQ